MSQKDFTYSVTLTEAKAKMTMGWPTKDAGRPSNANLEKFVKHLEESMKPGGANEHLADFNIKYLKATIQVNGTDYVVATWERPVFPTAGLW